MPAARYQIAQHPTLSGPHTKDELYILVERGSLGRGEIVLDRVTGRSHKVGELIGGMAPPKMLDGTLRMERPAYQEFSGDTPWQLRGEVTAEEEDESDLEEDAVFAEGAEQPGALYDGEPCIFHGHPSWLAYVNWLLLSMLLMALGLAAFPADWRWLAAGAVASSFTLCGVIIARQHHDYIITAERIEQEWGIIGRSSREVRIQDVRSMDVDSSGMLGLLGIGTLNLSSAGSDEVEVQFKNVRGAHKVKELIRKMQATL